MIPWKEMDRAKVPGQKEEITLRQRGQEFSIRTMETELMNSRLHGSEDELARLTCSRIKQKPGVKILIGGLGMGFTLAAALEHSGADSLIQVSELIPAVVKWNQEHLGYLAGKPLDDPRVSVKIEDVAKTIKNEKKGGKKMRNTRRKRPIKNRGRALINCMAGLAGTFFIKEVTP